MKLKANCTMTVKAATDCPVVAMLRPRSGLAQWMISERYELSPWVRTTEYVDSYGNLCQRLTIPQGEMRIEVEMVMETEDDIRTNWAEDKRWTPQMDDAQRDKLYAGWKKAVTRTLDWVDAED